MTEFRIGVFRRYLINAECKRQLTRACASVVIATPHRFKGVG